MRKHSLRQRANQYLNLNHQGSFKEKKLRAYVIHKMVDDLYALGEVPASWEVIKSKHLEELVIHWEKQGLKIATIMNYLTIVRRFLKNIGSSVGNIDNKSLKITRPKKKTKKIRLEPKLWQSWTDPISRLILGLEVEFGLTFKEAIYLKPEIHMKEQSLWLTREITFNSSDRVIPLRNTRQRELLGELSHLAKGLSLIQCFGYEQVYLSWRQSLKKASLPSNKSWRYLYAQQIYQDLLPMFGNYQACWLIRDEMGIKSRNTLWLYLKEAESSPKGRK